MEEKRSGAKTGEKKSPSFFDRAWSQFAVILLLTAIFLNVQSQRLPVPPWDHFDSWRQSDTYSMACNYVQFGMNLLRPQLNYDGVADNYAQLELQIVPFLSALVFQATGTMTPAVCRVLSLDFFLGSALFLYLLMRDFAGTLPALFGYGVYLFLPLSMLMSSSIQPESCALFFYIGGLYFLRRYQLTEKNRFLLGASVMTAVAIMEKTPVIFVGLVFVYVLLRVMGKGFYKNPWFYICGAVTLAPPVLLILYTSSHSVFRFVDGIARKHILTGEIVSLFTPKCLRFFRDAFTQYFGWAVILLSVMGMFLLYKKEYRFLLIWTLAFALECATIVAVIQFNYYLTFILPICAMLAALTLKDAWEHHKPAAAAVCAVTVFSLFLTGKLVWNQTAESQRISQTGAFIAENTGFDQGIAIGVLNPAYINAANRRGYRANIQYYDHIPTQPEAEVAYFIAHDVRWFVVLDNAIVNDADGSYLNYLKETFPVHIKNDFCAIYDLEKENQ